jgi:hypothetical protein
MIVWGGFNGNYLNDGSRYSPSANQWTPIAATGAPAARQYHTAVWTGSEMIVWGGRGSLVYNDGARYQPATDSWTAMTSTGAPPPRSGHTALWTGSGMIVWGGHSGMSCLNDTFNYFPDCHVRDLHSTRSGGDLLLSFPTLPGLTYSLWQSGTMADGTWTDTGLPALTGTGATRTFTVSDSPAPRRFFRVQVNP